MKKSKVDSAMIYRKHFQLYKVVNIWLHKSVTINIKLLVLRCSKNVTRITKVPFLKSYSRLHSKKLFTSYGLN